MRKLLVAIVSGIIGVVNAGNTLIVDKTGAGGAYTTIQAALDAASAKDTIFVKDGVYDEGTTTDNFATPMANRVFITKDITIIGESRTGTIIKGAKATVAEDTHGLGLGSDAVRCVAIAADNVVISNLTITGGATHTTTVGNDSPENNGGGIYATAGASRNILIADCDIVDNVARRAAGARYNDDGIARFRMTLARCRIRNNRADNRDPISRGCQLVYCLITRHPCQSDLFYACKAVNCTFADNRCSHYAGSGNCKFYNCLFADNMFQLNGGGYYNCGLNASEADCKKVASTILENCVYSIGYDHFISPITCDYRLYNGADKVINKGSYALLTEIAREDCRYVDFAGNAVPEGETTHLGCYQGTPVTPTCGMIKFDMSAWNKESEATGTHGFNIKPKVYVSFGGDPNNWMFRGELCYTRTMKFPDIVTLAIDNQATDTIPGYFGFSASGADSVMRYPYLDGTYEFAAPRDPSKTLTLTPIKAASVIYVEQDSKAATEDGTEAAPYKDLQTGINAIVKNTYGIVYCKGGTFDQNDCSLSMGANNRIVDNGRNVRIVGVGGCEKNIIVGKADSEQALDAWPFGCGANAARCICLSKTSVIQGFTLTGGRCNYTDGTGKRGSGAYISSNSQITDCVVSNNWGCQGVAINSAESGKTACAYSFRCYVDYNHSFNTTTSVDGKGSGMLRSLHAGMFIVGQHNMGAITGYYETQDFHHFTYVFDDRLDGTVLTGYATNYNSVVYAPLSEAKVVGQFVNGVIKEVNGTAIVVGETCKKADPLVAGPEVFDYRLGATSEARNYGGFEADYYGSDNYHIFVMRDFYGNPYRMENDKPVCGAVQAFAPTVIVKNAGEDGDITGSFGTNVLAGTTSSIECCTATKAATRPYLGMEINEGGVITTNRTATYTYNVPLKANNPIAYEFSAKALYDTNWYVAKTGSDSNWGTADSPKLTLKGALDFAISGDKVYAGEGEYNSNPMLHPSPIGAAGTTKTPFVKSRAYVPDGVELIGEGADKAFIVGASDTESDEKYSGCGSNAVRCVALGANSKLKGFTLKDGRAGYLSSDGDNELGGGVLAYYRNSSSKVPTIEDCIITNCASRRGGGGFFGIYNRCQILGNFVVNGGNGAGVRGEGGNSCKVYNSIIDGNTGYAALYTVSEIRNSTFGPNNTSTIQDCDAIYDTLLLKDTYIGATAGRTINLYNCAYGPNEATRFAGYTTFTLNRENCKEADSYDKLAMNGKTPVIGSNIAVDSAAGEAYGDTDVYGNPRKVNGLKLDIGAVEADWKAAYSTALGKSVTVDAADPEVELVGHKVKVPANASLSLTMDTEVDGKYRFNAAVEGGAEVAVVKDGESWKTISADGKQTFEAANAQTALGFTMGASGSAYLSRFTENRGLVLLVK